MQDVLGYFCFWSLTWWVWASAAAFSVRFRQGDWHNRLAAILQLGVFASLAAFTANFDITAGLSTSKDPDMVRADQIMVQLQANTLEGIGAQKFESDRLPTLSFSGIAMTMALSRIFLMIQYLIGKL